MSLTVSESISDKDVLIFQNDLRDIDDWVSKAVIGKINNCYKRMEKEWIPKLISDSNVSAISASREDFVNQVINQPSYVNAVSRSLSE